MLVAIMYSELNSPTISRVFANKNRSVQTNKTKAANRFQDGFLKHIKAPGLQGDANGLLVLVIIKATQKHLVDNPFEAGINAFLLLLLRQLGILDPQLGVVVNAFGCRHKEKRVFILLQKSTTKFKSTSYSLLNLLAYLLHTGTQEYQVHSSLKTRELSHGHQKNLVNKVKCFFWFSHQ